MAARNNNPMFQQLKVMFPNLDNSVLYSVWQSTNESIDAAIDVLLSFNDTMQRSMRASQQLVEEPLETRLAQREDAQYLLTPSGIIDPITNNQYFGDYIRKMQHKKKKKNRRGKTAGTSPTTTKPAGSASPQAAVAKKTRWIPLEEYTSDKIHDEWLETQRTSRSRNRRRRRAKSAVHRVAEEPEIKVENPFSPLAEASSLVAEIEPPQHWEAEELVPLPAFGSEPTDDELQPLLLAEPVRLSGFLPYVDDAAAEVAEPVESAQLCGTDSLQTVIERDLASYAWSMDDSYVWLTGSAEQQLKMEPTVIDEDDPDTEHVPDQVLEQEPEPEVPLIQSLSLSTLLAEQAEPCAVVPQVEPRSEQQWIVVKLYLDAGNIHRFSFARDQLSFERLQERVAHNLLQRADSPADCRAYAVTYEDEEGDRIAVCSQEELCEALRVHEDCIWPFLPAGELPILRLHVRPVAVGNAALNQGYIIA